MANLYRSPQEIAYPISAEGGLTPIWLEDDHRPILSRYELMRPATTEKDTLEDRTR